MKIAFDFAMLSTPYRMKRCSYQLMHLAIIAEKLGHTPICITSPSHLGQHKFMKRIRRMWMLGRKNLNCDIYVAKADAYYRDANWSVVEKLPGYKVCLCNSDRTFRESDVPFRAHRGNPVQERCDLYMPCNHSTDIDDMYGDKLVPAAHPVDPRMYKAFVRKRLYYAYLMNDLTKLRNAYPAENKPGAAFMGNKSPHNRLSMSKKAPDWCHFYWARNDTPERYIKRLCEWNGCLDLRGNGDKSLRFSEAAIFGRTLLCRRLPSLYYPMLKHDNNCILVDEWSELNDINIDWIRWRELSEQSTEDYATGWSLLGQLNTMIRKSGS